MKTYRRAISLVAATTVVASGFVMGAVSSADARPANAPTAASQQQLDLPLPPLPLPIPPPVLSGLGDVGSLLSVSYPVWSLPGVTTTFQWLNNGVEIPGATGLTYTPSLDDAGDQISVLVTGSLPGFADASLVTNSLGIPQLGSSAPSATTPPSITGEPKVGNVVTAVAPVWDVDGVDNAYQWQQEGIAIPGATALTYTVIADDVAKAISVKVTGTKPGFDPGVATSAPVTGLLGDAPTVTTPPTITGVGRVGQLLSVSPGTWSGAPQPTFSYQWLRNGAAISGAGGSTYVVQVADVAKSLTVRVTAARTGYAPGTATTSGISVAKLSSTTSASLVKKKIAFGKRGLLKITLRASGARPVGQIKVYDGSKRIKTYSMRAADNGSRIFRLPKLKPGTHRIKAVYAGSPNFVGSRSKVVTLKVLKRK